MAPGLRRVFRRCAGRLRAASSGRGREAAEGRMMFLLDTDTCIYALKQNQVVLDRLLSKSREDVAVSVITEAELRTGAAKSSSPVKSLRLIENFLSPITAV